MRKDCPMQGPVGREMVMVRLGSKPDTGTELRSSSSSVWDLIKPSLLCVSPVASAGMFILQ